MPDNINAVAQETRQPGINGAPAVSEPAFLARARRILAGNIRSDDYLPVSDEIAAALADEVVRLAESERIAVSTEAKQRILNDWSLQDAYGGQPVACRRTDRGVIVLAVGPEEIRTFLERFPQLDLRPGVVVTTPPPWQPHRPADSPNR